MAAGVTLPVAYLAGNGQPGGQILLHSYLYQSVYLLDGINFSLFLWHETIIANWLAQSIGKEKETADYADFTDKKKIEPRRTRITKYLYWL